MSNCMNDEASLSMEILHRNSSIGYCKSEVLNGVCWNQRFTDSVAWVKCPNMCQSCPAADTEPLMNRTCLASGMWSNVSTSQCFDLQRSNPECFESNCTPCHEPFRELIGNLMVGLSIASIICLLISIAIFKSFRCLQGTRLSIHMNLALAFIIRFASFLVFFWLWQAPSPLRGCTTLDPLHMEWICKALLFLIMYGTVASIYWMCVEGIYLASRLSFQTFSAETSMTPFHFLGWGIPLAIVVIWAALMERDLDTNYCWIPYMSSPVLYVIMVPILLILGISFLLMGTILVIIVKKLRNSNTSDTVRLWKTIKATLVLLPLIGITNLIFFWRPSNMAGIAFKMYIAMNGIVQHSQGIVVSLVYCFLNGEVQQCLVRAVKKHVRSSNFLNNTKGSNKRGSMFSRLSIITGESQNSFRRQSSSLLTSEKRKEQIASPREDMNMLSSLELKELTVATK